MKAIMISIKPQWIEKILNGEKTIEIRKTKPSCELPCKVYIYCTKTKNNVGKKVVPPDYLTEPHYFTKKYICGANYGECINGKVVAEFTLNKVDEFHIPYTAKYLYDALNSKNENILQQSCLDIEEMLEYLKNKYYGYAWHIDNLKIYDKPKELSEFRKELDCDDYPCNKNCDCKYNYYDTSEGCWACGIDFDGSNCIYKQLKRPPQIYCYVEEMGNE